MKRGRPLARRTPLDRGSGLKRTGRLAPRSVKQADRDAEIAEAILEAKDRDRWNCQALGMYLVPGCSGPRVGVDGQHLAKRSTAPAFAADPRNIITLCRLCHGWAEAEPLLAQSAGVALPAWVIDQHGPDYVRDVTAALRVAYRQGTPRLAPWLSFADEVDTYARSPRFDGVPRLTWPADS